MKDTLDAVFPFLSDIAVLIGALLIAELVYRVAMRLLPRLRYFFPAYLVEEAAKRIASPLHYLALIWALEISLAMIRLPEGWLGNMRLYMHVITIGLTGWLIAAVVLGIFDGLRTRYSWKDMRDNLMARRISTQLRVFRNAALFIVVVLTLIAMAMAVPGLRTLGISLFASAGVAGLVMGMAARPALSNLLAGMQLALTQPIRLDDVVIIKGEWGRIEEINATFVVVLIWDQRRLIVPLSYFIENPFENWTHSSSELLGTVFLYLDYTAPLEALREELQRIAKASPLWDKRVCEVQVTDSKEHTLEVRALISAADAGTLWALRCETREKLIYFLQQRYPQCLPRLRADTRSVA
jgi:small-conductance mechanosensitive channel